MIKLKNINKFYTNGVNELHVLKNINLIINSGDFIAIVGPSGSGKTSLLNLIGFLDNEYDGEYLFKGEIYKNVNDNKISNLRKKNVGFIFQNFKLIDNNTVFENISLPLLYSGRNNIEIKKDIDSILEKLGLENYGSKLPAQLSGGEQQRVGIARAIIHKPEFVIADEPTGSLDRETANQVVDILKKINLDGTTVVMVTHDMKVASEATRVISIVDGAIISDDGSVLS